jgi:hypothetical protein
MRGFLVLSLGWLGAAAAAWMAGVPPTTTTMQLWDGQLAQCTS